MIDRLLKVKCFNYQVNNKDFCNYESLELKKKENIYLHGPKRKLILKESLKTIFPSYSHPPTFHAFLSLPIITTLIFLAYLSWVCLHRYNQV